MKIFCLPYAGGSSSVFAKWKTYMSRDIEIVAPNLREEALVLMMRNMFLYSLLRMIFTVSFKR